MLADLFEAYPTWGSYTGYHRVDGRWTDLSEAGRTARLATFAGHRERLEDFSDDGLTAGVLTGAGGGFSAGMDLKAFAKEGPPKGFNEFLQGQGIMEAYTTALIGPLAVSGDGTSCGMPSAASAGSVAPIVSRSFATASSASSTMGMTGPDIMNSTSSS